MVVVTMLNIELCGESVTNGGSHHAQIIKWPRGFGLCPSRPLAHVSRRREGAEEKRTWKGWIQQNKMSKSNE